MAHFEKVDFPGMPTFHITDDYGHISELRAEQAYELYAWLHTYADEMWSAVHPRAVEALERTPIEHLSIEELTLEFMRTSGRAYHPEAKQELPDAVKAWLSAKPQVEAYQQAHPFIPDSDEKPALPTVRMLEIRLYQSEWSHFDELKAALPGLGLDYEAPVSEEHGEAVQVLSVKADSLTQAAIHLINDLQVEYEFRDQLVPMSDPDD